MHNWAVEDMAIFSELFLAVHWWGRLKYFE